MLKVKARIKVSKSSNQAWHKKLSRGVDDLPVTPNPREVDSKNQPLLYQEPLDLEPAWIKEPLHTSIPLELHFTTPVRWAQDLSQPKSGLLNNLLGGAPRNPLLQAV